MMLGTWLKPIILAIWEVEIGPQFKASLGKMFARPHSSPTARWSGAYLLSQLLRKQK
jgi:hypothetical protein